MSPKVLELFHLLQCYAACSTHWLQFLERHYTMVVLVLIFIPVQLHTAKNWTNAGWRPCSEDESTTKSSTKSKQMILQLPKVTPLLTLLRLSIQFIYTVKRSGDSTNSCLESNTHGEWLWFDSADTGCEQESIDLIAIKRWLSTLRLQHSKRFWGGQHRGCLYEGIQNCWFPQMLRTTRQLSHCMSAFLIPN